ncbi:uncharacterized protein LOC119679522 [Teleopsis dalmanni]|uniref:uncharacterized protein LOC119679522 n=1 Tax=Teleopsis dalmanni TaxID=139649 RepID=UPI0018CD80BF|nr:uncharacterized protein LOC119679522 [Teleopsis dalmanni]XP_037947848.1 uncharacterized protein LOC119679522 [Teleopsis dalmanni]
MKMYGKVRQIYRYRLKILALTFISTILLLLIFRERNDLNNNTKRLIIERSVGSLINQVVCRHPHLPIDNPDIIKFYHDVEHINCGNPLDDWVMCEKSICFVKPEILATHGEVVCSYSDIIRKDDYRNKYGETTKTKEPYVLHNSDFVKVACKADNGQSWYGMAFGIRDTVIRRNLPLSSDDSSIYYNVLIYGFDSLSRNAFIRKLPKTYDFLKHQLQSIVLNGYNIVGDGTPQALIPLLTGYNELELPETRKRMYNSNYVNIYPMIWKDYANNGYVTSFNEDVPNIGTFTYRMKGFNEQPVDHYLRTYYLESSNILSSSKEHCIGYQQDHVVMLNYTKHFMSKYTDSPRFVFSFHGGLSHDSINLIGAADDDVVNWLHNLREKYLLKNTILIFMADHGNRFDSVRATLQGKQEERLPYFSFAFPESFKQRYPKPYENFVKNADKLTTPFDVHATLKHLLKMQKLYAQQTKFESVPGSLVYNDEIQNPILKSYEEEIKNTPAIHISELASKRAISLFDIIPENRSCADAYIEPHWCACLQWTPILMNNTRNNGKLLKMADSIVNAINNATMKYRNICASLELVKINWAMHIKPNKDVLNYKGSKDKDGYVADMSADTHMREELYQLQILVSPGNSLFEASVSHDLQTFNAYTKLSEISRVNKYGDQARCIYERDPELRKYCYCR